MAVIEKEIRLVGSKGERMVEAIFDSGSTYSCIGPQLAKELGMVEALPEPLDFGTAVPALSLRGLRAEGAAGRSNLNLSAKEAISLNFHLDGYRFSDEFMLIDSLSEPVLIGAATLQKWRLKLNFETDEVIVDPKSNQTRIVDNPKSSSLEKVDFRREEK